MCTERQGEATQISTSRALEGAEDLYRSALSGSSNTLFLGLQNMERRLDALRRRAAGWKVASEVVDMSGSRADAPELTDATHSAAPRAPIRLDEAFDDPAAVLARVPRQQMAKRMAILGREHPDHLIRSMRDLYYAGGFNASDAREGVRAFVEKRKPVYRGKSD